MCLGKDPKTWNYRMFTHPKFSFKDVRLKKMDSFNTFEWLSIGRNPKNIPAKWARTIVNMELWGQK